LEWEGEWREGRGEERKEEGRVGRVGEGREMEGMAFLKKCKSR